MKKTIGLMLFVLVTVSLHAQSTNGNSKGSSTPVEKAFFFTEKKALKFGNIVMGTSKTLELNFTNTGKKTLVIKSVYTNCGCTSIDYPEEPFAPGKSGVIKVTYTPTDEGPFNKTITINTNAVNATEVIKIEGITIEK